MICSKLMLNGLRTLLYRQANDPKIIRKKINFFDGFKTISTYGGETIPAKINESLP